MYVNRSDRVISCQEVGLHLSVMMEQFSKVIVVLDLKKGRMKNVV